MSQAHTEILIVPNYRPDQIRTELLKVDIRTPEEAALIFGGAPGTWARYMWQGFNRPPRQLYWMIRGYEQYLKERAARQAKGQEVT